MYDVQHIESLMGRFKLDPPSKGMRRDLKLILKYHFISHVGTKYKHLFETKK